MPCTLVSENETQFEIESTLILKSAIFVWKLQVILSYLVFCGIHVRTTTQRSWRYCRLKKRWDQRWYDAALVSYVVPAWSEYETPSGGWYIGGWKMVRKINSWPRSAVMRATVIIILQYTNRLGGVYLLIARWRSRLDLRHIIADRSLFFPVTIVTTPARVLYREVKSLSTFHITRATKTENETSWFLS